MPDRCDLSDPAILPDEQVEALLAEQADLTMQAEVIRARLAEISTALVTSGEARMRSWRERGESAG